MARKPKKADIEAAVERAVARSAGEPVDFKRAFGEYVKTNQKVWATDRSLTVGASEAFFCSRSIAGRKRFKHLADIAEEFVDSEWGHAERGNIMEDEFVVPALIHMFGEENCLFMGQANQKTLIDGKLSCTPDGLVINQPRNVLANYGIDDIGDSCFVPEIKSFAPSAAPRGKAKPRHMGQNNIQIGAIRRSTNYDPSIGVVIYSSPVDLKDVRPFPTKYDQKIYDAAKRRADDIFDLTKKFKDYPAEGKYTDDCQYCEFQGACAAAEIELLGEADQVNITNIDPQQKAELERLTRAVAKTRADYTALEKEKKRLESELKTFALQELKVERYGEAGWSYSIFSTSGKKSFDKDAFIENAVDRDDLIDKLTALAKAEGLDELPQFIMDAIDASMADPDDYQKTGNPYLTLRTKADE